MPDFEREDDWWRNGQNLYLDNMAVTGFYRVPLSSAQAGDILLCCFGASVANHAAIYCGSDDLNGINVKYRYEFTDTLGMVTSFSYAGDRNRQLTRYSDTRWHEDSVRNRWFSVMAGPSVRVNEWFSAYAMAGVAYSRVSIFSGDYLRVTDNKGKTHDVLTGSDDG
ncbi:enterobacterial Ail/Lom family protein, partial [Escherichia coli CB7326]|uniref:Ail/Lom family outer membrane beta-barrel protein n=1 Tax=Escherichia coli TaxID=562 RepID=UPI00028CA7E3